MYVGWGGAERGATLGYAHSVLRKAPLLNAECPVPWKRAAVRIVLYSNLNGRCP